MADPDITIHDSGGVVIPEGTPVVLPTATPGTPTADTVLSIRNNDAAGPAVDDAINVKLTILARVQGASSEPLASGLLFLDERALEVQVTAVSGGATAPIVTYRPLGKSRSISLETIPDGGIVTTGARINSSLAASLTDVEVFLLVESLQATPVSAGIYESQGNFIYDGRPGGTADPLFSQILTITGALAPDSPNDDSVDIWTRVEYTLAGVEYVFVPATPEIVYTDVDGDAASLLSGEAYYAAITLDGTNTANDTRGSKNTTPLQESDKPTPPAGEFLAGWVIVPFGLVITTVDDVLDLDFFGATQTGGLGVDIGPGRGLVGGYRWDSQTDTSLTLADDEVTEVYVKPSGGLEQVTSGNSPTDPHAMLIWTYTTVSGSITLETDERRIGSGIVTGAAASMGFRDDRHKQLFGVDYSATGTYVERAETGQTALATNIWRQITPYATVSANPNISVNPMLLPADTPVNLKAISTSSDDTNTGPGTGANRLRAVHLDASMIPVAVEVLLSGTSEVAVSASSLGLITARVSQVGSGGEQAGDIAMADDAGGFSAGVPLGQHFGKIPLELSEAPVVTLGDPAGVTTGLVIPVPTATVCALSQMIVITEGPILLQVNRKSSLGKHVLWSGAVKPGDPAIRWEAPPILDNSGSPAAIPEESWIEVVALSVGGEGLYVSGRLDYIFLGTS